MSKHPTPFLELSKIVNTFVPLILKTEVMAINSKDIEALWKRYSDEGVKKGISVVQFFGNRPFLRKVA